MAVGFPTKANWAAGDVLTASQMDDLAGTVNTIQNLKPWNQILNSNMSVWQRGTSIAVTTTSYTADRWFAYRGVAGATVSRQATSDTTNLPNIQYCARVQRNAADTSTSTIAFSQSVESVNSIPYAGKTVTMSFYARAGANFSATSSQLTYGLTTGTGTDQNVVNPGYTSPNYTISQNPVLTTTWQRFSYSGALPSTATEFGIYFQYNPVGTAGANDYFEVTGVQVEIGSVANTYQPNQATYEAELAACERYYERLGGSYFTTFGLGLAINTTSIYVPLAIKTKKRVQVSSVDYSSNLTLFDGVTTVTVTAVSIQNTDTDNPLLFVTTGGVLVQYRPYLLIANNNQSSYVGVSAEL